jgi:uncharacterized protein with ParB-like and HNH nuclease domain
MASVPINTSSKSLAEIFTGTFTYSVPAFQRDYSWTEEECDELWLDIEEAVAGQETDHFMGYLVLKSSDGSNFEIIDGQQRITTLTLIMLAAIKSLQSLVDAKIDEKDNQERISQLRAIYVGYKDPETLEILPKLRLNRNNNSYFQDRVAALRSLKIPNLQTSNKLLKKSFDFFDKKIQEKFDDNRSGAVVAKFLRDMANRLYFSVIQVTTELNAFKVFETLNARGVRLSPTDLLKNYLFSVVAKQDERHVDLPLLERRWVAMVERLGGDSFTDFLRTHWNSREQLVREKNLFKTIRNRTASRGDVFSLIRALEEDIDVFDALKDHNSEIWTASAQQSIKVLNLFGIRQHFSVIIAAKRLSSDGDMERLLRACEVLSFRYNAIMNLIPRGQEETYNEIARYFSGGNLLIAEAINKMSSVYPIDIQFLPFFQSKELSTSSKRNRDLAKYILAKIERQVSGLEVSFDSQRYNLEHVLPESGPAGWDEFSDAEHEKNVYRLGNFALIERDLNARAANRPFAEKREIYRESQLQSTRGIFEHFENWSPDAISTRQQWMARQASAIWRLAELDP